MVGIGVGMQHCCVCMHFGVLQSQFASWRRACSTEREHTKLL